MDSVDSTSPDPSREAEIFSALGHPVRLALVRLLADGPRCACELEPQFDLNQSTISRHLTTLRRAGVIDGHKEGVKRIYAIRDDRVLAIVAQACNVVEDASRSHGSGIEGRQ